MIRDFGIGREENQTFHIFFHRDVVKNLMAGTFPEHS
jgi:hypothetical protein